MLDTGGASILGSSAELNETGTFDPLEIRESEEVKTNNVVLKKLVIDCIAVCILSSISYNTVCGQI
ncbi:hypothetical protein TIFTF001_024709 [Ficus carica]|uniref:Uncharacterized protein n=1 Tax=Ficus carica TaxID=3494 RepID=A0AA88AY91_FICCA|nr:hypothetical protein TIFTF001_024709 [Ficus carica]